MLLIFTRYSLKTHVVSLKHVLELLGKIFKNAIHRGQGSTYISTKVFQLLEQFSASSRLNGALWLVAFECRWEVRLESC